MNEFCLFLPKTSLELRYEAVFFAFEARKHSLDEEE